jgi:PRC-barrel domain
VAHDASENHHLCFVESRHLQGPLVDPLDVWTSGGRRIGSFNGVVVDPEEGRARYLVVDRGRLWPDRCLIPLPARLDLVHQTLCVDEPEEWETFDTKTFPPLTVNDLATAVLAARA